MRSFSWPWTPRPTSWIGGWERTNPRTRFHGVGRGPGSPLDPDPHPVREAHIWPEGSKPGGLQDANPHSGDASRTARLAGDLPPTPVELDRVALVPGARDDPGDEARSIPSLDPAPAALQQHARGAAQRDLEDCAVVVGGARPAVPPAVGQIENPLRLIDAPGPVRQSARRPRAQEGQLDLLNQGSLRGSLGS